MSPSRLNGFSRSNLVTLSGNIDRGFFGTDIRSIGMNRFSRVRFIRDREGIIEKGRGWDYP